VNFLIILITVTLESDGTGFLTLKDVYSFPCLRISSRDRTKLWVDLMGQAVYTGLNRALSCRSMNVFALTKIVPVLMDHGT
jgi:hypothetical protein